MLKLGAFEGCEDVANNIIINFKLNKIEKYQILIAYLSGWTGKDDKLWCLLKRGKDYWELFGTLGKNTHRLRGTNLIYLLSEEFKPENCFKSNDPDITFHGVRLYKKLESLAKEDFKNNPKEIVNPLLESWTKKSIEAWKTRKNE